MEITAKQVKALRDSSISVEEYVKGFSAKVGECVKVAQFSRITLGSPS